MIRATWLALYYSQSLYWEGNGTPEGLHYLSVIHLLDVNTRVETRTSLTSKPMLFPFLQTLGNSIWMKKNYWLSEFHNVVRRATKHEYLGWEMGHPEDRGRCGSQCWGDQNKTSPAWGKRGWGGLVEKATCPGFATAPWTGSNCEFQESSSQNELIFLQMRKGALREGKLGWALTFNFQTLQLPRELQRHLPHLLFGYISHAPSSCPHPFPAGCCSCHRSWIWGNRISDRGFFSRKSKVEGGIGEKRINDQMKNWTFLLASSLAASLMEGIVLH